jgi:HipA-like C-terminal domain
VPPNALGSSHSQVRERRWSGRRNHLSAARRKWRCPRGSAIVLEGNILFWLLGATDGHAKNFSVFLSSGGRFRLTPLYDVISAQPSVNSKRIPWKQFRLAMAVGSKRHYKVIQIAPHQFVENRRKSGLAKRWLPTSSKNCETPPIGSVAANPTLPMRQEGWKLRQLIARNCDRTRQKVRRSGPLRGFPQFLVQESPNE